MAEPALPRRFRLDVVKPDGLVLSEEVDEAVIPGALGSFGVLAGHAPLLTLLGAGELMYRAGSERRFIAIAGGFCEVRPAQVTVLAETAERAEEIDLERARRARERAEEHLRRYQGAPGTVEEIESAGEALRRADVWVAVGGRRPPGASAAAAGV